MNLYDKDDGFKRFTLEEANAALIGVIAITERAVAALESVRVRFGVDRDTFVDHEEPEFEKEAKSILENWSNEIMALGCYPKGYFTVDFKSPIPDTLLCWTFGEQQITHTHKIHEGFKDRHPIQGEAQIGFEQALN